MTLGSIELRGVMLGGRTGVGCICAVCYPGIRKLVGGLLHCGVPALVLI
jgi:hypothetical protein